MSNEEKELNKAAQDIAKYFFEKTGQRSTTSLFGKQISFAKQLINAGFSPTEIKYGVDWCIEHPPKGGFFSLKYLDYVLNEVVIKKQAEEIKLQQQMEWQNYQDLGTSDNRSNYEKFQQNNKPKVKGI